ncbi:MAG: hypothetical protein HOA57_05030 [Candidatus Magasanikbacteria bacterium]|jgi:hypothetical protein|nr:hypothetical protein [Candidatus Magasanikbacteria bacterium]MBT4315289.1 hypothetical protein [Candidatus Magasanikbacteria bacterium]MBT4547161.1 hypothetical protein [Candidatus Magasanikbacteria bacterium]MBT6819707.1 hypothetical protein [Candidatus Magasanikbacteria bacterium]
MPQDREMGGLERLERKGALPVGSLLQPGVSATEGEAELNAIANTVESSQDPDKSLAWLMGTDTTNGAEALLAGMDR